MRGEFHGQPVNLHLENDRLWFVPASISSITSTDTRVTCADLKQLNRIETLTTLEQDAQRLAADEARVREANRRRRTNGAFTGAVLGGGLDYMHGKDSILDGALYGAIAGAAVSGNERAESGPPMATLRLGFRDGEVLNLRVTAQELAWLNEVWMRVRYMTVPLGPSVKEAPVPPGLIARANKAKASNWYLLHAALVVLIWLLRLADYPSTMELTVTVLQVLATAAVLLWLFTRPAPKVERPNTGKLRRTRT